MVCYGEVKTFVVQSYFSCISKGFFLLTAEFHVEGHIMITFIRSCHLISDFDMREVMPFISMTQLCLSDPTISVLFKNYLAILLSQANENYRLENDSVRAIYFFYSTYASKFNFS